MSRRARTTALLSACAAAASCVTSLLTAPFAAQATDSSTSLPVQASWVGAITAASDHPDPTPSGSNNWECKPSFQHPRPVVLVHNTASNAYTDFAALSPALRVSGYCVYALNYGKTTPAGAKSSFGTARLKDSGKELSDFVQKVLDSSGAHKVDLVGAGAGGLVARAYLKWNNGADPRDITRSTVANLVTYGTPNHGTTREGMSALGALVGQRPMTPESTPAVADQIAGSEFITSLNADGETIRGVRYTVMGTQYDEAVDPWSATFLNPHEDQRAIVRNIPLQDGCPADFSDVVSFPYSPRAIDLTMQSLDPQSGITVRCTLHHPIS